MRRRNTVYCAAGISAVLRPTGTASECRCNDSYRFPALLRPEFPMRPAVREDAHVIGHNAMRAADRFLGIPACAVMSALRRATRWLGRPSAPAMPPQRILFVQLAESGSMVLADPAMRELMARTGAHAYCLTFASNRASLSITGTLAPSQVFALRSDSAAALVRDAWRFLRWVREARIDTIVDLELFSRLTAVLCLLTGASRRAGFHRFGGAGVYRGDLFTHPVAFDPRLHMAQNYLRLVEGLIDGPRTPGMPAGSFVPRLQPRAIGEAELVAVRRKLAARLPLGTGADTRVVLVNANASDMLPQRRWPQAHFVSLVRELLGGHPDVVVLLIGARDDFATTNAIAREVADERCVDAAGVFAMEELPALFSLGAAMVSNDSGPAHFAAVTALPVVVLFGPETPVLFRPLGAATVVSAGLACSPCVHVGNQRRSACADNQCMKRISVADVLAATRQALDAPLIPDTAGRQRPSLESLPQ